MNGLYGISDTTLTPNNSIFAQLESSIKGGLKIFQYRDKENKNSDIENLICELQNFCKKNNVTFILNDRFELALKLGLDGLHLGKDELKEYSYIRKNFKGIIGISCYDDINMALKFQSLKADYVAFGAMFKSNTKPDSKQCSLDILKKAKEILNIPICAIGGINCNNVKLLKSADMIAVISSLWRGPSTRVKNADDYIRYNAQNLIKFWKE